MIFFDVDTQYDFLDRKGALYVQGSELILGNLERLLTAAGQYMITTVSTRCAHQPGDPEFEMFPPHCVEGTQGAGRVFTDLPQLPHNIIEVDSPAEPQAQLQPGTHYIVKKNAFDPFSNPWLDELRQRGEMRGHDCIVFGVATDYCVRATALGLAQAGAQVRVVADAVRGVAAESTARTLEEMHAAGVILTTTDEVIHSLTNH